MRVRVRRFRGLRKTIEQPRKTERVEVSDRKRDSEGRTVRQTPRAVWATRRLGGELPTDPEVAQLRVPLLSAFPLFPDHGSQTVRGPFPPPELIGFIGPASPSAIPHGLACLSRVASCSTLQSPLGLPVLRMVHFAYMPSPIPRQVGWNLFARTIPSASAFPRTGAGRLLPHCFRGLLSVHSRNGLHARRVALAALCTRGFSSLVASTAALIATGWSEPVPGRVYPRCGPAPSRRTRFRKLSKLSLRVGRPEISC